MLTFLAKISNHKCLTRFLQYYALREKFSNLESFRSTFSHIQTDTESYSYLPIFSPNAELYGPEKLRIQIFFQGVMYFKVNVI